MFPASGVIAQTVVAGARICFDGPESDVV